MTPSQVTEDWLKQQSFQIVPGITIDGLYVKDLTTHLDGRGEVTELWSEAWVDNQNIFTPKHSYQSATDFGVIKCWHLHENHTDQFTVTRGKLQVSLVDTREGSPTFGQANKVVLGSLRPRFIKIPAGVMHGWKALSQPEVLVVNYQTEVYDPTDEFKFTWDCVLPEIWEPRNG